MSGHIVYFLELNLNFNAFHHLRPQFPACWKYWKLFKKWKVKRAYMFCSVWSNITAFVWNCFDLDTVMNSKESVCVCLQYVCLCAGADQTSSQTVKLISFFCQMQYCKSTLFDIQNVVLRMPLLSTYLHTHRFTSQWTAEKTSILTAHYK